MILDERTEFADAGDFATEAGTSNVGDVIDLGTSGRSPGGGQPVYLIITIETSADGGAATNGTTAFQLVSDSVSTPATNGTQTIHFTSDAYLGASQLTAGDVLVFPLPSGMTYERYLGMQVVQAVEGEDDLVASAYLSLDPHEWVAYPDATN